MSSHLLGALACAGLVTFATGACGKSQPEIVGFGKFEIGKSTPEDGYACRPQGEQTYCSNNPSPVIAGHPTQTDLFFRGHDKSAPLVEILVGIWQCKPEPVRTDLLVRLGEPAEEAPNRLRWKLDRMAVVALLPQDPELCTIHFLDHSETARFDELWSGKTMSPAVPGAK